MSSTQEVIPIEDVKDNLVFLKDGSVSLVLSTTAVNFALLFETEQVAIIESFAGLLNSLSFPIQILIISKRLDVSSYLKTLDQVMQRQTNPKLANLTANYRGFVENMIKEKDVLDKQFYICLNVAGYELGVLKKKIIDRSLKATTVLSPRRDHIIRQLGRLGLKARQLQTTELVNLFYDLYNPETNSSATAATTTSTQGVNPSTQPISTPIPIPVPTPNPRPSLTRYPTTPLPPTQPLPGTPQPQPFVATPQLSRPLQPITPVIHYPLRPPFIVEELSDDIRP